MKKMIAVFLSILFAHGTAITAFAANDWEEAYREKMAELAKNDSYPEPLSPFNSWDTVAFYDMDGNGIPEMFYNDIVFSYNAGKIVEVGSGYFYYVIPENNTILRVHKEQDMVNEWWMAECRLKDGKIIPRKSDIMQNGKVLLPPQNLFVYLDFNHQKYFLKGKEVKDASIALDQVEKQAIFLEREYAHFVRSHIDKPLTEFLINRIMQAVASNQRIAVDGKKVEVESYLIGGNNYCKLRDIAFILKDTDACFNVGWLNYEKAITVTTGQKYTGTGGGATTGKKQAVSSAANLYIDGESVQLEGYTINGSNYFKLRDIAEHIGAEIEWNVAAKTANIITLQQ